MYRIIRKIHFWLSIPFGLIISLICITGLILLFEPSDSGEGRQEFFIDVMRLHRWLMDAPAQKGMMTTGKMIVGVTTVAFVAILLSGVWLWAMRLRGVFLNTMKIRVTQGWDEFCRSLHIAGGAYVVLFLLVMALTGLTWSYGGYREWFYSMFGIAKGSHVVYGIHAGLFGGIITKIIWGIAALTGFTLPLTGYWMWGKRNGKWKMENGK